MSSIDDTVVLHLIVVQPNPSVCLSMRNGLRCVLYGIKDTHTDTHTHKRERERTDEISQTLNNQ